MANLERQGFDAVALVNRTPALLTVVPGVLNDRLAGLAALSVDVKAVVVRAPALLVLNAERLDQRLDALAAMGIAKSAAITEHPALCLVSPEVFARRLEALRSHGLTDAHIADDPNLLAIEGTAMGRRLSNLESQGVNLANVATAAPGLLGLKTAAFTARYSDMRSIGLNPIAVLDRKPELFNVPTDELSKRVEVLLSTGVPPGSARRFLDALVETVGELEARVRVLTELAVTPQRLMAAPELLSKDAQSLAAELHVPPFRFDSVERAQACRAQAEALRQAMPELRGRSGDELAVVIADLADVGLDPVRVLTEWPNVALRAGTMRSRMARLAFMGLEPLPLINARPRLLTKVPLVQRHVDVLRKMGLDPRMVVNAAPNLLNRNPRDHEFNRYLCERAGRWPEIRKRLLAGEALEFFDLHVATTALVFGKAPDRFAADPLAANAVAADMGFPDSGSQNDELNRLLGLGPEPPDEGFVRTLGASLSLLRLADATVEQQPGASLA